MFTTDERNIGQTTKTLSSTGEEEYFTICPSCRSNDLKVRTVRKNKSKYYYCKNCKKSSASPIKLDKKGERLNLICHFCGTGVVRKGHSKNKKQRYRCSKCRRYTVIPKITREKLEALFQVFCIACKNIELKKRGFNKYGKQVYYCNLCRKRTIMVSHRFVASLTRISELV